MSTSDHCVEFADVIAFVEVSNRGVESNHCHQQRHRQQKSKRILAVRVKLLSVTTLNASSNSQSDVLTETGAESVVESFVTREKQSNDGSERVLDGLTSRHL